MAPIDIYLKRLTQPSKNEDMRYFLGVSDPGQLLKEIAKCAPQSEDPMPSFVDFCLFLHWMRKGITKRDLYMLAGRSNKVVEEAIKCSIKNLLPWALQHVQLLDIPEWSERCRNTKWVGNVSKSLGVHDRRQ
jgi:hypothetical protein